MQHEVVIMLVLVKTSCGCGEYRQASVQLYGKQVMKDKYADLNPRCSAKVRSGFMFTQKKKKHTEARAENSS